MPQATHVEDVVDYVEWNDDAHSRTQLAELDYGPLEYANPTAPEGLRILKVPTAEGWSLALPGEYVIIHHADIGFWPITNYVFHLRYYTEAGEPS